MLIVSLLWSPHLSPLIRNLLPTPLEVIPTQTTKVTHPVNGLPAGGEEGSADPSWLRACYELSTHKVSYRKEFAMRVWSHNSLIVSRTQV